MNNFTNGENTTLDVFRKHLNHTNRTSQAQHVIIKETPESNGTSINICVPLKMPEHFFKKDPDNAHGDIYFSRDDGINEMSEMLHEDISLACLSEMVKMVEDLTSSEVLFIRCTHSPTALFLSTPQILILMVHE